MNFKEIKKYYNDVRTEEANRISTFFKSKESKKYGFEPKETVHNLGVKNYKSGSRLLEAYDLSNWKWVCVKRNNVNFFISLQTFDRDPKTGNMHILMDRIGIYAYVGKYSSTDAQTKMMITNIELPMDDEKLNKLRDMIRDLSDCELYKWQLQFENVCDKHNLV